MRITILTSLILAALTTTVAARARVPRSLLVGLKRQGETSPVIADAEGECPTPETQTSCGGPGDGCCDDTASCTPSYEGEGVTYTCEVTTSEPAPEVEGTEPEPDNGGTCDEGSEYCPTGGCCATTCLAADAEGSTYVCEIVEAPPPEETTSTEDIVTSTPAPRPPPTGNNNPTPTRTPNRSTTSSRSTGSTPTNAPGDGAGSVAGKSAVVVAGLVGAMMALA